MKERTLLYCLLVVLALSFFVVNLIFAVNYGWVDKWFAEEPDRIPVYLIKEEVVSEVIREVIVLDRETSATLEAANGMFFRDFPDGKRGQSFSLD